MKRLLFLFAFAALCAQAEIYKWTDEKGQVHYGEQPPPTANTTTIKAPSGPPSAPAEAPAAAPGAPAPPGDRLKAAPRDKDGPNKTPTDKSERCTYEKQQLELLSKDGEVRYYNEQKQLVTLPAEKREAAKAQVQENIKRYCS